MAPSPCGAEEVFLLEPDHYQAMIPLANTIEIKLGSRGYKYKYLHGEDTGARYFRHDMGRFLFPPYVIGLRGADEWLSVGMLEMPFAEFGLRASIERGGTRFIFNIHNIHGALAIKPGEIYQGPKIGFFFAGNHDEMFHKYIGYLFRWISTSGLDGKQSKTSRIMVELLKTLR